MKRRVKETASVYHRTGAAPPVMSRGLFDDMDRLLTFQDFCDQVEEDTKANLLDGVVEVESPASERHEKTFAFLMTLMNGYSVKRDLGLVLGSRMDVRLSEYQAPEPDLSYIKNERMEILKEQYIDGPPDLVVEIASPSTRTLDLVKKRALYADHGVAEYWVIDPEKYQMLFLANRESVWEELPL